MAQMITEPFLTFAEAGRYLGTSRQQAHKLAKRRLLTIVTLNGRNYVTLRSVKHYQLDSEQILRSKLERANQS